MVKAIIFDLQGTLVENGVYPSPLRQVRNILRIDISFSEFVMRFEQVLMLGEHSSLKDAFINVCEEFGMQPKDFLLEKIIGLWNKNKLLSQLYPDTIDALIDLKKDYKLVLVANIDCFTKEVIDRFKLNDYFDIVLLSCDTGLVKGDKKFYNSIFTRFNITPSDVVMVGDSLESDMSTAKALGMQGILIDRNNKREFSPKIMSLTELRKYLGE
ncbi:MAG: HAD family hydrolase [Candidatus Woesearchaeota archaeon]